MRGCVVRAGELVDGGVEDGAQVGGVGEVEGANIQSLYCKIFFLLELGVNRFSHFRKFVIILCSNYISQQFKAMIFFQADIF